MPEIAETTIQVEFGEHMPHDRIGGMLSMLEAYGNVLTSNGDRRYSVNVYRKSKMTGLIEMLAYWQRRGFVNWTQHG